MRVAFSFAVLHVCGAHMNWPYLHYFFCMFLSALGTPRKNTESWCWRNAVFAIPFCGTAKNKSSHTVMTAENLLPSYCVSGFCSACISSNVIHLICIFRQTHSPIHELALHGIGSCLLWFVWLRVSCMHLCITLHNENHLSKFAQSVCDVWAETVATVSLQAMDICSCMKHETWPQSLWQWPSENRLETTKTVAPLMGICLEITTKTATKMRCNFLYRCWRTDNLILNSELMAIRCAEFFYFCKCVTRFVLAWRNDIRIALRLARDTHK